MAKIIPGSLNVSDCFGTWWVFMMEKDAHTFSDCKDRQNGNFIFTVLYVYYLSSCCL